MDLAADRGMRQAELLARADDAPLLGDDPEVEQVVVVEPLHDRRGAYVAFYDDGGSNFRIAYMAAPGYQQRTGDPAHGSQADGIFSIGPTEHRARPRRPSQHRQGDARSARPERRSRAELGGADSDQGRRHRRQGDRARR